MITELTKKVSAHGSSKIKDLDALAAILRSLRLAGKKIIHCHGVFDLLHAGHVCHFEEAKKMGDILIVTLTPDIYVNKGPHRPAFPQQLRARVIAALEIVDYVAINRWPAATKTIELLRPDIYVKGPDYRDATNDVTGNIEPEAQAVRSVGGKIEYTDGVTFSSSNLLNRHWSMFTPEAQAYLENFRQKYSADEIRQYLESLRSLKVLVVGETILDEYIYGDTIGKSAKESVLAMRYLSRDLHAGGILAVANHIADFCDNVKLVTYLGATDSREEFVRSRLKSNIEPFFVFKSVSPTIVKRRYIENYSVSKLLEIYEMNDETLNKEEEANFCELLDKHIVGSDVVVVADYGHGLIDLRAVNLFSQARFLAVNTQINAANIGFHAISKYKHADYVCIHEGELRLDCRSRKEDVKKLTMDLAERLECDSVMVTMGSRGTLFCDKGRAFSACPSFAVKVIDRIGAGDAVLALTSLCVRQNFPADVTNFIGNLVGAQAVMIVGNKTSIGRVPLMKAVGSILQ
ncbi:MAG: adenylyltransferase/cytidyltransferase family protein [Elusimicrobia bacterium]|nr:adenylyltransferase/cytidyltransferase family protein [Elusimicrobiota bacterium]